MKCPYCAEEIKDEAIACKYCNRDFFVVRPMLDRIQAVSERLTMLERKYVKVEIGASGPLALAASTAARIDRRVPLLSPFSTLTLTFIFLVIAHFLIIIQFDLSLIYLRIVSIVVPAIFGFLYRGGGNSLWMDFLAGLAVSIFSILAMSAIVGKVDHIAILPHDRSGWIEFVQYGASITFGFFTGVITRYGLSSFRSASAHTSRLINIISTYIGESIVDKGKGEGSAIGKAPLEKRLQQINSLISSIIAISSAAISIATGLHQFFK